ncbi:MAG: beta family protein [Candidatus Margulisbacteria bacterium]|nr:beta family protein [Candidatus Margulisiibacteriota bacterium]
MAFNHFHYVPCLKWKTGEYQAILKMPESMKKMITPLIEVPEYTFDHEERKKPKTLDHHIELFIKRVGAKWGGAPCFVDIKNIHNSTNMGNGKSLVAHIYEELFQNNCSPILVTGVERADAFQAEIINVLAKNSSADLCLRLPLEEFAKNGFEKRLQLLLERMKIGINKVHLIIDLGAPNFIPLDGFFKAIQESIYRYLNPKDWMTFSIVGTSMPNIIKQGVSILPRYEWKLYKTIINQCKKEGLRLPAFGDYAVTYPSVTPDLDWTKISSSAKMKYTIDDGWYLVKGKSLRDGPPTQFHDMCRDLVGSSYYSGQKYSFGDQFIQKCATDKSVKTRNHTLWVTAGTNHHLVKVALDIANLYASS